MGKRATLNITVPFSVSYFGLFWCVVCWLSWTFKARCKALKSRALQSWVSLICHCDMMVNKREMCYAVRGKIVNGGNNFFGKEISLVPCMTPRFQHAKQHLKIKEMRRCGTPQWKN